ncbi:MAG: acyl-CoA dehydrogenase family protein [Dehalococcoidia bacterium]
MTTQIRPRDHFELHADTDAGRRLEALCEAHAVDFAARSAQYDRDGTFPFENIAELQRSGVMAACVPEELGGMGITSLHDLAIGINRLARGDGSTALAVNMHSNVPWLLSPVWQAAAAAGDAAAAPLEELLRAIGAGQLVIAAAFSEAGTDMLHPLLTGTRTDGGWSLAGRKTFGTAAMAAQLVFVTFRAPGSDGSMRTLATMVPVGTPGMAILDGWDALGMRATASNDIDFHDCLVPENGVTDLGTWGEWSRLWLVGIISNHLGLVAAFLGIAETARDLAIDQVTSRRKGPSDRLLAERSGVQHIVAENEIDLAACRAALARTAQTADMYFAGNPDPGEPLDALQELMKDFQCTKTLVTLRAVEIVNRAMTLSGGAGYLASSRLAQLYRDVRAGPFMQPFSPYEAFEYIGKVTLGLEPTLDV